MIEIAVTDIRKVVGGGKMKAIADVKMAECMVLKGFCVMEGKNGVFVTMPRKASKDGRWFDIVEMDGAVKRELEHRVLASYDRETDGVRN